MEFIAVNKSVRMSPRKVRLIADGIGRNIPVMTALGRLSLMNKRAASAMQKTLKSAIANALHNGKIKQEDLVIKRLEVVEGPVLKRFHPSTRGRVHPYKKRSSHITVIVEEQYGTKS